MLFATGETSDVILCGVATYLIVAPIFLLTAFLCGWVLRQRDVAREAAAAEGGPTAVAPDRRRAASAGPSALAAA